MQVNFDLPQIKYSLERGDMSCNRQKPYKYYQVANGLNNDAKNQRTSHGNRFIIGCLKSFCIC